MSLSRLGRTVRVTVHAPSIYGERPAEIRIVLSGRIVTRTLHVRNNIGKCPTPPTLLVVASSLHTFVASCRHGRKCASNNLFKVSLLLSLRSLKVKTYPLGAVFATATRGGAHGLLRLPSDRMPIVCVRIKRFLSRAHAYQSAQFRNSSVASILRWPRASVPIHMLTST